MPNHVKIYAFRCGATALYGLSTDPHGTNLPTQARGDKWQFDAPMTLRCNDGPPESEIMKVTLAAIEKHGFYLIHAPIQPETATRDSRAQDIETVERSPISEL